MYASHIRIAPYECRFFLLRFCVLPLLSALLPLSTAEPGLASGKGPGPPLFRLVITKRLLLASWLWFRVSLLPCAWACTCPPARCRRPDRPPLGPHTAANLIMATVEIGPPPPGRKRTGSVSTRSIGNRSVGAMSAGQLARQRSTSSGTRSLARDRPTTPGTGAAIIDGPEGDELAFRPCAATASIFLYAHQRTIYCLHHDTLALERRFEKHKANVRLLVVDNVSERGAGRLVVSYDAEQTTIVWDMFTGEEVTRFACYQPMSVAAWMKNGNIAFGNARGEVVLFEPSTSEHQSARTIYDPITALAPANDCQTYAIGFVYRANPIVPDLLLTIIQVQEWLHPHRQPLPLLHNPPDPLYDLRTLTYPRPSMACLIVEAEVGHAGRAEC